MHKDFICAYHNNQTLTNFCACSDCLLPVCPLCIKLHSEEHQLNETRPQYQSMTKIFQQIRSNLNTANSSLNKQVQQLIQIQKTRKQNNQTLKSKIIEYRDRAIRQFSRAIENIQHEISQLIINDDQQFILEIEKIDDAIIAVERSIQKQIKGLESQQSLKTVINYYATEQQEKYSQKLRDIDVDIQKLSNRAIVANFNDKVLGQLKLILRKYIDINIIIDPDQVEFASDSNRNNQKINRVEDNASDNFKSFGRNSYIGK